MVNSQLNSLPCTYIHIVCFKLVTNSALDLDTEPTESEIAAIKALIETELSPDLANNVPHPDAAHLFSNKSKHTVSPALDQYIKDVGKSRTRAPGEGIDLTRYSDLQSGQGALNLKHAYVALEYAESRAESLTLLAEYGRNQWLIGNDQLEQTLKQVELEVERERAAIEAVNGVRRDQQSGVKTTLEYLETRWREGIRNVVDVNVACLQLEASVPPASTS